MKKNNIFVAIIINIVVTLFEVVIGLLVGSLALVSDAVHNFTDVGALSLSWWGEKIKDKHSNKYKTYGYKRAEILIALFNSMVLLVVIGFILFEAVGRIFNPAEIAGKTMIITAIIALVGNGIATYLLKKDAHKNLNLKSAWLHSLQDALFSLGVVGGSILIYFFHWYIIDPIISIFLAIFIFKGVYELLRKTLDILMEGVPDDIDFEKVKNILGNFSGVSMVSDMHIWQTDSNSRFLSAHLEIENIENEERNNLLSEIQNKLIEEFNINHITIQMISATEAEKLKFKCNHCN
ncbi:MAG: cation diffusion facilitator family transporter [Candidatus Moranbacteria bacterium]|jgi:cobalt-zinc-cadmium efflux system protein|nr:cation diffusion facilitator family transporter [Candidatus Moranbacteria bacterium]